MAFDGGTIEGMVEKLPSGFCKPTIHIYCNSDFILPQGIESFITLRNQKNFPCSEKIIQNEVESILEEVNESDRRYISKDGQNVGLSSHGNDVFFSQNRGQSVISRKSSLRSYVFGRDWVGKRAVGVKCLKYGLDNTGGVVGTIISMIQSGDSNRKIARVLRCCAKKPQRVRKIIEKENKVSYPIKGLYSHLKTYHFKPNEGHPNWRGGREYWKPRTQRKIDKEKQSLYSKRHANRKKDGGICLCCKERALNGVYCKIHRYKINNSHQEKRNNQRKLICYLIATTVPSNILTGLIDRDEMRKIRHDGNWISLINFARSNDGSKWGRELTKFIQDSGTH